VIGLTQEALGTEDKKKNKTSSAVHCIHRASGAHGYAEDHRSQHQNKQLAFLRMSNTKEFQEWRTMEVHRKTGLQSVIEDNVNRELKKIKVEVKDHNGLWKEVDKNVVLPDE
jgi:protein subunit release factor B